MIWSIYNCSLLKSLHQSSKVYMTRKGKKNISLLRDENIFLTWDENISLQFYRTDRQITLLGNWCSCPRANILQTMSPWKYVFYKNTLTNSHFSIAICTKLDYDIIFRVLRDQVFKFAKTSDWPEVFSRGGGSCSPVSGGQQFFLGATIFSWGNTFFLWATSFFSGQ